MKNRLICTLLASMILVLSTTACGSTGTKASPEKASVESSNTEAADETAPAAGTRVTADSVSTGSTASETGPETAQAAGTEQTASSEEDSVVAFPQAGITFTPPESFKNLKGLLPNGGGEIAEGTGIYCMYYNYVALSEDDYTDLLVRYRQDPDNAEKYESFMNPRVLGLFSVYAADGGRTAEDIIDYLKETRSGDESAELLEKELADAELIKSVEDYNFYFIDQTQPDAEIAETDSLGGIYDLSGYPSEYDALVKDVKSVCSGLLSFSIPEKTEQ